MPGESDINKANEQIQQLESAIEDLTRQVCIEQEHLRKTRDYFSRIIGSVQTTLIVLSDSLHIVSVNSAGEKLLKATSAELVSQPISNFLQDTSALERLRLGDSGAALTQQELIMKSREGDAIPILFSATLVDSSEDGTQEVVCIATDVREKKQLEGQLLQAQKLESIGQLAAGIAHEINTPIQFVGDNTRFLQDAFQDLQNAIGILKNASSNTSALNVSELDYLSAEIPRAIEQTLDGITRVSKIVRAMKEFAHPGTEDKQAIDINGLLDSTSIVSRNEWKYAADLELILDKSIPLVPCHPAELNQAFLNLIVNAAHAVAEKSPNDKGKITIKTSRTADHAIVAISDTGNGIPDHIAGKIFDPFFTTKPVGKGTGQGLSMTRSIIVERHGGTVSFSSKVGEGTTFEIRLPLRPADEPAVKLFSTETHA